jgi:hypothetical protein
MDAGGGEGRAGDEMEGGVDVGWWMFDFTTW